MQHHTSHVQLIFQEKKVQSEIQLAYLKFIQSVPRRPAAKPFDWKSHHHHCTDDCDFVTHQNVLICKQTGNWHYCTEETCDRLIRTTDSRVCQLTGSSYSLLLEMDLTGDYHGNEDHDHDDPMSAGAPACDDYGDISCSATHMQSESAKSTQSIRRRKRVNRDPEQSNDAQDLTGLRLEELQYLEAKEESQIEQAKEHQEEDEQERESTVCWDQVGDEQPSSISIKQEEEEREEECVSNDAVKIDSDQHFSRIALFESVLQRIFPVHRQTHMALMRCIAVNAARLWTIIQFSNVFQKSKQRYALEYHLLVVVYYMCAGFSPLQTVVVPYNEWIHSHIPQVRDLKRVTITRGTVKVPNFTQASKLFKSSMFDLVQHQMKSMRGRLQWVN